MKSIVWMAWNLKLWNLSKFLSKAYISRIWNSSYYLVIWNSLLIHISTPWVTHTFSLSFSIPTLFLSPPLNLYFSLLYQTSFTKQWLEIEIQTLNSRFQFHYLKWNTSFQTLPYWIFITTCSHITKGYIWKFYKMV